MKATKQGMQRKWNHVASQGNLSHTGWEVKHKKFALGTVNKVINFWLSMKSGTFKFKTRLISTDNYMLYESG